MVSSRPFCKSPNQLCSVVSAISLSEVTHGDSADCLPSSQLCSPYATGINSLKLPNKLTVIQNKTLSLSTACMLGEEGGGSFSSPSEAMSLTGGVTGVQVLSGEWRPPSEASADAEGALVPHAHLPAAALLQAGRNLSRNLVRLVATGEGRDKVRWFLKLLLTSRARHFVHTSFPKQVM